MPKRTDISKVLVLATMAGLLLLSVPAASGCSWVRGYFYQVTRLRGRVVGRNLKFFPPLQYMDWLRHSFDVPRAQLTLYTYRESDIRVKDMTEVARVSADGDGRFDFGALKAGHYRLSIVGGGLADWFNVEVIPTVQETESITIDISPVLPNCLGGHEFMVRAMKARQ